MSDRIADIQESLFQAEIDGWLFYDFRGSDPIGYRVLGLASGPVPTRRWFYFVPAWGEPVKLVHKIEPRSLEALPGREIVYLSHEELAEGLKSLLKGAKRVAMQYSPLGAIPYLSRTDAGIVELVRSLGVEVVSSQDLIQRFEAVWTPEQLESHLFAANALGETVQEAFAQIAKKLRSGTSEHQIQQFIRKRLEAHGLLAEESPLVAVNAHSADPHYAPSEGSSLPIKEGDFVLLDLWARKSGPGSVYADITWVGYAGSEIPEEHRKIWDLVKAARDAAIHFVSERWAEKQETRGWEVDDVARRVIREAGYGDFFIHRLGHSLGQEGHGNGTNLDNLETHDERRLVAHTGFTIEPGIYLPGQFGVRSEVDVYLGDEEARVTTQPVQDEIIRIQ
jgi:Xaa-Pro aminopeptidase